MSDVVKIFLVVFIFIVFIGVKCNTLTNVNDVRVTVKKTERVENAYLVYTDNGVYSNHDSMFHGKWNSSDVYGKIIVGKSYIFTVYGVRWHLLTAYKNIKSIKEID